MYLSIEDSEIYTTSSSRLNNATTIPVKNNSRLLEDDQAADIDFYVFSTSAYYLELESGWCSLSQTSGMEYDTIQVHFDNNLTDSDRSDTIAIYSEDGFVEKIILSQSAGSPSNVQQEIAGNKLSGYPSPGSDFINLSIPEQCQLPAKLSVVSIDVKGLSPGFYILQLNSEGSQLVGRFIVK